MEFAKKVSVKIKLGKCLIMHVMNSSKKQELVQELLLEEGRTCTTICVTMSNRPDFKRALSTLRQLKEQEEEAQRNQRRTQSYPPSWWNWQGTWWTPYSYESHHGDVPSTD